MKRRDFGKLFAATAVLAPVVRPLEGLAEEPRAWSFVADVSECCSCEIPCSCNFGRPEQTFCHGTRLIQIRQGQLDGADLAGINFAVTFYMGVWTRIYIDDTLDASKSASLDQLLPLAFGGFDRGARIKARVPLSITPGASTFAFSVPESSVEMRLLPGLNGEPIRITGLPSTAYQDYVQYESVVHTHRGPDETWSHVGTNGFRSVMRASG
jgi:hypothetical protein